MRLNTFWRSAFACAAMTFASSCSSDSTGPDYASTVTPEIAEEALETGSLLLANMMYFIDVMGLGTSPGALRELVLAQLPAAAPISIGEGRWRVTVDPRERFASLIPGGGPRPATPQGCSITESGVDEPGGDPIDANENGIPDDYRRRSECVTMTELGGDTVITESEIFEVTLRERTDDLTGFELGQLIHLRIEDDHGHFQETKVLYDQDLSIRSDRATHHFARTLTSRSYLPGDVEVSLHETGEEGQASFDPFGTIALGAPLPDGELTLNGHLRRIDTDQDLAFRFEIDTPEPLEFDGVCAETDQQFVAGVLRGRVNGNNGRGFTVTFNACGVDPDIETFGIGTE